jgi:hypothetical protein
MRICKALDEPPRTLAIKIGVEYAELEPLLDNRYHLAEIDRDEVWERVAAHVDQVLGELLAAREELRRARRQDVQKRMVRMAAQGRIGPRKRPRRGLDDG